MGEPPRVRSDDDPEADTPKSDLTLAQAKAFASSRLDRLWAVLKAANWDRPGRIVAGAFGVVLVLCVVFIGVMIAVAPGIPRGADLYALNRPQALTFTDQKGEAVGVRGAIVGDRLKLAEMPKYLPAAFMAMEDRDFYKHPGIDLSGLLRAAYVDLKAGRVVQGGSTITQQVVKIVLLSPDRTFSRKLQEFGGAFVLENKLSKDEILDLYLNRIYLGSGAYGVDGASQVYFGKSARRVTLPEAAMLAALTRAPSAFSPRRDLASAQMRAGKVLDAMVESGAITKQQADEARAHPATVIDPTENLARDYFLDAAADEVKALAPYATGDLNITTTMDPALQEAARAQIARVLNQRSAHNAHAGQGALVSIATDGEIRALIGGKDYAESAFNRITKAHRQPGSAFKPFVYLAALENGLTPWTTRVDEPVTIKDKGTKAWSPDNYTEMHLGPMSLQQAFAQSINTIAVQLGQEVGPSRVISVAHRLGIESPLQPVASIALGTSEVTPLELAAAYASFATVGQRVQPYTVLEIRKPDGTVLYRRNPPTQGRVISEAEALAMNDMMYQVVQWGTGRGAAVPGHEVAGKTGTSADYRDAWFVGFSPEFVTAVWVGNDDFTPMKKVTGGSLPAQIWSGFMRTALKDVPPKPLPRALPPQPQMVDYAPTSNNDQNVIEKGIEGVGNGIGSFFNRLFGGGDSNGSSSSRKQRSSDANDGRFFPEENDKRFAMEDPSGDMPAFVPMTPPPERPQAAPTPSPDELPTVQRRDMPVPRIAPPPPSRFTEQRSPRDEESGQTFVFQNGETGEQRVFRGTSRGDQANEDRYAPRDRNDGRYELRDRNEDRYAYRDRNYDPPPRFAPPPRYDFPPPPRYDNGPRFVPAPPPPPSMYEPPRRERDYYPEDRPTRPGFDFPDR